MFISGPDMFTVAPEILFTTPDMFILGPKIPTTPALTVAAATAVRNSPPITLALPKKFESPITLRRQAFRR